MKITQERFLEEIRHGVDWGGPFKVRWSEPKGRFFIFTVPGSMGWAGRGSRAYYPAQSYLIDLAKAKDGDWGYNLFTRCQVRRHEGRLTKFYLMDLIGSAYLVIRAAQARKEIVGL